MFRGVLVTCVLQRPAAGLGMGVRLASSANVVAYRGFWSVAAWVRASRAQLKVDAVRDRVHHTLLSPLKA